MRWNEYVIRLRMDAIPDCLFDGRVLEIGGRYPERILASCHRDAVLKANNEGRWLSIDLVQPLESPLNFEQRDLFDMDVGEKWDSIICCEVIEHIELRRWPDMFHIFRGLLRPSGRLFITTPYKESVLNIGYHLDTNYPHDPANIHVVFDISERLIELFLPGAEFQVLRAYHRFRENDETLLWALGRGIWRILRRHPYAWRWARPKKWLSVLWRKKRFEE